MKQWPRHKGKNGLFGRSLKGLLLLGLFLAVLGLASSATLHKAFHPNASNADHHCVVTLLTSGQVDVPPVTVDAVAPAILQIFCTFRDPSFETDVSFNLPLSRGPPALLS